LPALSNFEWKCSYPNILASLRRLTSIQQVNHIDYLILQ
jgi:hypothetical protein